MVSGFGRKNGPVCSLRHPIAVWNQEDPEPSEYWSWLLTALHFGFWSYIMLYKLYQRQLNHSVFICVCAGSQWEVSSLMWEMRFKWVCSTSGTKNYFSAALRVVQRFCILEGERDEYVLARKCESYKHGMESISNLITFLIELQIWWTKGIQWMSYILILIKHFLLFQEILLEKLIQIDCDGDAAVWSKSWQSYCKQRIMLNVGSWSSGKFLTRG